MTGISRRNLLKGAAFSAAGVAALGLAGCAPQTEATKAEAGLAETGETAKHTWEVKPEPIAADQISQTVVFCWFQLKQRSGAKAVFMHLVFPALGALVCFAILMSVGTVALVTGVVFILIGIAYYLVLTRVLHRQINLG